MLLDLRTRLGSLALLGGVKKRNWPHDITDWGPVASDSTYWKLHLHNNVFAHGTVTN